ERLDKLQSKLHKSVEKKTKVSIFANLLLRLTFNGGYITAYLWSAYGLAAKRVTFGMVTAYLQLVNRIQRPIFNLIRLLPSVVSAKTAIERLIFMTGFKLEESRERVLLQGRVSLKVNNVTFSYSSKETPVLSNFSMEVKPGTMVAVMGETGVGKTTLLRLLLALVKPNSGTITIENETQTVEVSESTRSNFVYVPQGGSLFSGTIRNNLLLGNANANDTQLEETFMKNLRSEIGHRTVIFITHHPSIATHCDYQYTL
ncbi:MAG: ABC transporter ATP-binding protein/permease, partial [Bacteroidales bacterium]